MKCADTIVFLCLLLSVYNVATFNLIQDKPHVNKNDLALHLGNQQPSDTRQTHTCIFDCDITLLFNESLIIPETCIPTETTSLCTVVSVIDYVNKEISFYSYANSEGSTIENITYDSAIIHAAYLDFIYNGIYHIFEYTCLTGDQCEWKYMQEMIPKLIILDYHTLFDSLLPLVYNSDAHPYTTQCYNDSGLINCTTGSCLFAEGVDQNYNPENIRECAIFEEPSFQIGTIRHLPGPARHDYDIMTFTCDIDKCNSHLNEDTIRRAVSQNGNIYVSSLGSSPHRTSFSFFFITFASMLFLK